MGHTIELVWYWTVSKNRVITETVSIPTEQTTVIELAVPQNDVPKSVLDFLTARPHHARNLFVQHKQQSGTQCSQCAAVYPCQYLKWACTAIRVLQRKQRPY